MRRLRAVAVAAALLAAPAVPAQEGILQVPAPILTLDQERLFEGSRAAARFSDEMEQRTADLAAENRRIEAQLSQEELDLTERRAALTPEEFNALADAFHQKVEVIREEQDAKARALQQMQEEERQDFLRRITPILAEIVRERGALAVLDRRSMILSADSIDITDEAIRRINAELDQSAPDAPAPAPAPDPAPETPAPAPENPPAAPSE